MAQRRQRVEIAPGLDERIAAEFLAPRVDNALRMMTEAAQRYAPSVRVWVSMRDDRVRRSHQRADGQQIPDNLRFKVPKVNTGDDANDVRAGYDLARFPRDPNLPIGNRINCFPGVTRVRPVGALRAIWRALYQGDLVTVRTAAGGVLAGTPNHPVVTPGGLVALGSLHEGDHLVHSAFVQTPTSGLSAPALRPAEAPHVDDRPPTIAEVFIAAASAFGVQRMLGVPVDLYGDPLAGEVEVVAVDGQLRHDLQAAGAEGVGDFSLSPADVLATGLTEQGLRDRLPVPHRAAASLVGGRHQSASFRGVGSVHADLESLAATPHGNPGLVEKGAHASPGHPRFRGDRQHGLATAVAMDKIVQIERSHFAGHVYTFTTSEGIFEAEGYLVGNCRCADPTLPHPLRDSLRSTGATVVGTRVDGSVETRFPRAAESEFGTDEDVPAAFMRKALAEVAQALNAGHGT